MRHFFIRTAIGTLCMYAVLPSPYTIADEVPRSIMFEQPAADLRTNLQTVPGEQAQDGGDRCAELVRKMDALKGRPQQRYVVSQQFEAECQR